MELTLLGSNYIWRHYYVRRLNYDMLVMWGWKFQVSQVGPLLTLLSHPYSQSTGTTAGHTDREATCISGSFSKGEEKSHLLLSLSLIITIINSINNSRNSYHVWSPSSAASLTWGASHKLIHLGPEDIGVRVLILQIKKKWASQTCPPKYTVSGRDEIHERPDLLNTKFHVLYTTALSCKNQDKNSNNSLTFSSLCPLKT